MTEIPKIALTHGGKFHADDVFSSALLELLEPEIKITRAFEVPQGFEGLVFDIGGGPFDHHQAGAEVRPNGVPYAAFGLLWREFGGRLLKGCCPEERIAKEAAHFDEVFIQPLDEDDNTGCGNQLAGVISAFNPQWDSADAPDTCFFKAVELASDILRRRLEGIASIQRARSLVEAALEKSEDGVVELPRFAPWKTVLVKSTADFVVYPSQRGGYSAQAVPADTELKELKCPFPESWAGRNEEELRRVSGVGTLSFCHRGRFLISAGTLDDTVKACKKAREVRDGDPAAKSPSDAGGDDDGEQAP